MASAEEIRDRIVDVRGRLDTTNSKLDALKISVDAVKTATDAVHTAVDQVNNTLASNFKMLVTLGQYTNQALFQNAQQNDTIICILEHISKNTCLLLDEAHTQTGLQTVIKANTTALADLYAATHPDAALGRERLEALRKQIEECCPPKAPEPICRYEPCPAPRPLREPPAVGRG
jgi:hypothetical protein